MVPGQGPPSSSGPGWNDPPPMALTAKPKTAPPKTVASNPVSSQPITQPLMMGGAPAPDPYGMPPAPMQQQQYGAPPTMYGQGYVLHKFYGKLLSYRIAFFSVDTQHLNRVI